MLEDIPFEDNYFDIILSKYAIHISPDISPIFSEIYRVLKPNGISMYLTNHPLDNILKEKKVMEIILNKKLSTLMFSKIK